MTDRHIAVQDAGWRSAAAVLRRPAPVVLGAALLAPLVLGGWTAEPGTTRGGEVRDGLRLSVSTNTSPDPAVRLRAGEAATRTYHLSNRTEYPLGNVVLSDPQLPGGQFSCGADRSVPPGGAIDCTATLTVAPGPQSTRVWAVADAPNHLPQSHADASTGYLGITAGIRLARLGTPSGTGLSHRSTPRTPPSTTPDPTAAPGAARPDRAAVRPVVRAAAVETGSIELQYRLEAFGDVPITAASITEGLPGLGEVNCTGPDSGHTIAPGQAVDCRATGTARPGRQTGTARAEGTADDATVGPDGSRQAPRRVSAEASGTYDGLQPTPPSAGPTEPTTAGSGPGSAPGAGTGSGTGAGQGAGSTGTGTGQPAPGTAGTGGTGGVGATGGAGTAPGSSTDAVPPGLLPITVPPGAQPLAVAPGQPPANAGQALAQGQEALGQGQQPAAGAPALAGQLLGPFLPGQAPALLPGGTAFARSTSPFAAPGQFAASTPFTSSSVAPAAANPSAPAHVPSPAAGQQSRPAADRSPGAQAQSQYATGDWPAEEEDRPWDTTEVMMLLLALILPVLCVLAAMFTVRNRSRR